MRSACSSRSFLIRMRSEVVGSDILFLDLPENPSRRECSAVQHDNPINGSPSGLGFRMVGSDR